MVNGTVAFTLDNNLFGLAFGAVTVYVIIILKYVFIVISTRGFTLQKGAF